MLTTDPTDPRLGHGPNDTPGPQNKVYLVLSQTEIAKGFVRPLRRTYKHVGEKPKYPLRELTQEEHDNYDAFNYVAFEVYLDNEHEDITGRYWTQKQLDNNVCGAITTMALEICETYARNPSFYGSTYCTSCRTHKPVEEFIWVEDGKVVGS